MEHSTDAEVQKIVYCKINLTLLLESLVFWPFFGDIGNFFLYKSIKFMSDRDIREI